MKILALEMRMKKATWFVLLKHLILMVELFYKAYVYYLKIIFKMSTHM